MEYYYRPLLPNGRKAPLPWEVRLFFVNIDWPLADNSPQRIQLLKNTFILAAILAFLLFDEAHMHFIWQNINDIGLTLECMATMLILNESHFRIFKMTYNKIALKALLANFFQTIYIERAKAPEIFANIQRDMLPTKLVSYSYLLTLLSYLMIPIVGLMHNQHLLPYKVLMHYDYTPWYHYILLLLISSWLGLAVVSHLSAESNLLAMMILHLNEGYLLLQHDLRTLHDKLLHKRNYTNSMLLSEYRHQLIACIRRNVKLNEFAKQLQACYSFSIFIMLAFTAVLLCVLLFKAVTLGMSSKNLTFVIWIIGRIIELMVFGSLGSTLIHTTNEMSSTYYHSNWELIILKSNDTHGNIEIMKLIRLAITLNQRPFHLSGYNFFYVSLETGLTILRGAGSYFTFLYAFY